MLRHRALYLSVVVIAIAGVVSFRWRGAAWHSAATERPVLPAAVSRDAAVDNQSPLAAGHGRGAATPAPAAAPAAFAELHASFRKAQQCADALSTIESSKSLSRCDFYDGKPEFAKAYADCLEEAAAVQAKVAVAEKSMVGCGERKGLVRRYFEAARAAAVAGDTDAQMCVVVGFDTQSGNFAYTEAERIDYKARAPRYIDAALQRGDWRVVRLLATHVVDWAGPWVFLDEWRDPAREYEAQRLLRLGSEGDYARALDDSSSDRQYPEAVRAAGDAWAQEMYEKHFSSRPALEREPHPCDLEDPTP